MIEVVLSKYLLVATLVTALLALTVSAVSPGRLRQNRGSIQAMNQILQPEGVAAQRAVGSLEAAVQAGRPQADWLLGILAQRLNDETLRRTAQSRLLEATPARLILLRVAAPDDTILAEQAVQRYPDLAQALVWRAGQLVEDDPRAAADLYGRALALDPVPYDWWLGLGKAHEQMGDYPAARIAYQTGCDLAVGVIPCHELQALEQRVKAGKN